MMSISSLIILLALFGHSSWAQNETTGPRVGLIYPFFIGNTALTCKNNNLTDCQMDLYTRAAQYNIKIPNLDPVTSDTKELPTIIRTTDWKPRKAFDTDVFNTESGQNGRYSVIAEKAKDFLKNRAGSSIMKVADPGEMFLLPSSYLVLNGRQVSIRDGSVMICERGGKNCKFLTRDPFDLARITIKKIEAHAPIVVSSALPSNTSNQGIFQFLQIDAIGRVFKTEIESKDGNPPLLLNANLLFAMRNPFTPNNPEEIVRREDLPTIGFAFKRDLVITARRSYIQAITPVFSTGKSSDDFGLCFSSSFRSFKGDYLSCGLNGKDSISSVPQLIIDQKLAIMVHAIHMINYEGRSLYHIAYSLTPRDKGSQQPSQVYSFCKFDQEIVYGQTIPGNFTVSKNGIADGKCVNEQIITAPSDIVGYNDGKCLKTIAFYDLIYTVHAINGSVLNSFETEASTIDGLYFKINAVFYLDNKFYFFTLSNTMLIANGRFDESCKKLTIDLTSIEEKPGHEFIIKRAAGVELNGLPFIDYMELEMGANDTKPPANISEEKTDPSSASSWILIIIGVIIGLIVLAGLYYVFFLREKEVEVPRESRTVYDNLQTKTIRSAAQLSGMGSKLSDPVSSKRSNVGSKASQRSPGARSPLKSRASSKRLEISSPIPGSKRSIKSFASKSPISSSKRSIKSFAAKSPGPKRYSTDSATMSPKSPSRTISLKGSMSGKRTTSAKKV